MHATNFARHGVGITDSHSIRGRKHSHRPPDLHSCMNTAHLGEEALLEMVHTCHNTGLRCSNSGLH